MKNKFHLLFFSVCIFALLSCKKDKDKPDASFTFNYVENGGVYVEQTGKGTPEWDFGGDGVGPVDTKGTRYYKSNGTYTIKLTTTDIESGKTDTKEQTVTITGVPTKMKLSFMKLYSFNPTNSSGNAWDSDATGPDIYFQYFQTGTTGEINTLSSLYSNITTAQLPITFTPSSSIEFSLSQGTNNVQFFIADDDYTTQFSATSIESVEFVPNSLIGLYPANYTSKDSNGNIKFEVGLEWLP